MPVVISAMSTEVAVTVAVAELLEGSELLVLLLLLLLLLFSESSGGAASALLVVVLVAPNARLRMRCGSSMHEDPRALSNTSVSMSR